MRLQPKTINEELWKKALRKKGEIITKPKTYRKDLDTAKREMGTSSGDT